MPESNPRPIICIVLALTAYLGFLVAWADVLFDRSTGGIPGLGVFTVCMLVVIRTVVYEEILLARTSRAPEPSVAVRLWLHKGDHTVEHRARLFGRWRKTVSAQLLVVQPEARAAASNWAWTITAAFVLLSEAAVYALPL